MDIDDEAHPKIRNATSKWKCGVTWRPKPLSRSVVTLVEERVEGLQDKLLVLLLCAERP
jgi:hypothetical protein